jgi:hypothetical protein
MYKNISLILITLLLSAITLPVFAASVHKWVDEQGITHYSDQLPETTTNNVQLLDVSNTHSNSEDYGDYYSVTNQWARMREERLERKQSQLEKAKQKAAQQPASPQIVYLNQAEDEQASSVYYPAYLNSFSRRVYGFSQTKRFNHHSGRYLRNNYGQSCRYPRKGYTGSGVSRIGSSGLTLTTR